MLRGIRVRQFLHDLYNELNDDNVYSGAAALGFYLTLAIFPGLILLMTAIPYLPIDQVDQAIMELLGQALPAEAYELVDEVVTQVTEQRRGGLLSFSLLATLWAASSGMYAVMRQLNITYSVQEARSFVRGRATAIGLSLLFGVLVIGAFTLIVLGGAIEDWLSLGGIVTLFFATLRWVIVVLALLLALALIYHFGPNVRQRWAIITPGSVFGTVTLIGASLAFAFYTRHFANYDAIYGSIGAVIVLMLWLYIAGLVILIGSEINAILKHGKRRYRYQAESARR